MILLQRAALYSLMTSAYPLQEPFRVRSLQSSDLTLPRQRYAFSEREGHNFAAPLWHRTFTTITLIFRTDACPQHILKPPHLILIPPVVWRYRRPRRSSHNIPISCKKRTWTNKEQHRTRSSSSVLRYILTLLTWCCKYSKQHTLSMVEVA